MNTEFGLDPEKANKIMEAADQVVEFIFPSSAQNIKQLKDKYDGHKHCAMASFTN